MPTRRPGAKTRSLRSGATALTKGDPPPRPRYHQSCSGLEEPKRALVRGRPQGSVAPRQPAAPSGHRSSITRQPSGRVVVMPRNRAIGPEPDALESVRLLALFRMAASLTRPPLQGLLGSDQGSPWVKP